MSFLRKQESRVLLNGSLILRERSLDPRLRGDDEYGGKSVIKVIGYYLIV
jgi:hypothetical protein